MKKYLIPILIFIFTLLITKNCFASFSGYWTGTNCDQYWLPETCTSTNAVYMYANGDYNSRTPTTDNNFTYSTCETACQEIYGTACKEVYNPQRNYADSLGNYRKCEGLYNQTNAAATCSTSINTNYFCNGYGAIYCDCETPTITTDLTITTSYFNTSNQELNLAGTCETNGTGIKQLQIIGQYNDWNYSTSTMTQDPYGQRGESCDCSNDTFFCTYNGNGLTGTHPIAIINWNYQITPLETTATTTNFGFQNTPQDWIDWNNSFASSNNTSTPGNSNFNAYNMACSADEWATPDPEFTWWNFGTGGFNWIFGKIFSRNDETHTAITTLPWLNFTKMRCQTLYGIYRIFFGIGDKIKDGVNLAVRALNVLFPFNIPLQIKTAWDNSTETLPAGLSYWDTTDANGNINIKLPPLITGGTTTTYAAVFGKEVFEDNQDEIGLFGAMRNISTYLMWGIWLLAIWKFGKGIYDEMYHIKNN